MKPKYHAYEEWEFVQGKAGIRLTRQDGQWVGWRWVDSYPGSRSVVMLGDYIACATEALKHVKAEAASPSLWDDEVASP